MTPEEIKKHNRKLRRGQILFWLPAVILWTWMIFG